MKRLIGYAGFRRGLSALAVCGVLLPTVSALSAGTAAAAPSAHALDTSWGGTGTIEVTDLEGYPRIVGANSGKVFAVSSWFNKLIVARYLSDGSPDPSFGTDGIWADLSYSTFMNVRSAVALPDDSIVISAYSNFASADVIIKLNSSGSPDPSFGSNPLTNPGRLPFTGALTRAGSGKLMITDGTRIGRLTSSGAMDPTFNGDGDTDGWITMPGVSVVGVSSDQKIVISTSDFDLGYHVTRLMPNGSADDGPTGFHEISTMSPDGGAVMLANDSLVLTEVDYNVYQGILTFYDADGQPTAGKPALTAAIAREGSVFSGIAPSASGGFYVYTTSSSGSTFGVRYVTPDGKWSNQYAPSTDEVKQVVVDGLGRPLISWSHNSLDTFFSRLKKGLTSGPPIVNVDGRFGRSGAGHAFSDDPVDTFTGNLTDVRVDLQSGVFGLDVVRSFNGRSTAVSTMGPRWQVGVGSSIKADGDGFILSLADASPFRFAPDGSGGFITPDGSSDTLTIDPAPPSGGGTQPMLRVQHTNGGVDRFDTLGRLIEQTNWDGQTAVSTYDAQARLHTVTGSSGLVLTFAYNTAGLVIGASLSNGRTVSYGYNGAGLLSSTSDEFGATTTITYTAEGWLATMVDPSGVVLEANTYDSLGRVITQTAPNGGVSTFTYFDEESVTEVRSSLTDSVIQYHHDPYGKVIEITDALGNAVTRSYDAQSNPTGGVSRSGTESTATYDLNDNVTSVTQPGAGTTSYVYDSSNRVTSMTDPAGATTTYTYDGAERIPSSVTDALGHATTYNIVDGLTTSVTDADGVTTTYAYDSSRHMTSSTDGLGHATTFTYDGAGRRTSTTTPGGRISTSTYGISGRLLSTSAPDGGVTSYTYDAAGRVLTTTDPKGAVTTNVYNAAGDLEHTTDPVGNVTSYTHDANGEVTSTTKPGPATTTSTFGAMNRLLSTSDELERATSYTYDVEGRTTAVTDPTGASTQTTFDSSGRVASTVDESGRATTTTYDTFGRTSRVTTPDGDFTEYNYDAVGRAVHVGGHRGGYTNTTYTPGGRVATITDPSGLVTSYGYDLAGRRKTVTAPGGRTTTTTFNADGQTLTTTSPGGLVTSYTYDSAGRAATVTDPAGVLTTRTWTLRGELATEKIGSQGQVQYVYDNAGRMTRVTDPLGNITTFAYDQRSNMTSRTNAIGGVDSWTFDLANELKTTTDPLGRTTAYDYDPGGRVSQVAQPNGDLIAMTYNADGTMATRTAGAETTTYDYDSAGRVTALTNSSGTITYTYDGNTHDITEQSAPGGRVTRWTYDILGRRTSMRYPDGESVTYSYNSAGQLGSISLGELMGDSFTQSDGSTPLTTKWTPTLAAGATISASDQRIALALPAAVGASATLASKVPTGTDNDVTFSYQFASTNSSKLTLYSRFTTANSYRLEITPGSSVATVYKKVGATTTTLGNVPTPNTLDPTWVRFQNIGGAIKVKIWGDGQIEPSAWTSTFSTAAVTTNGTTRLVFATSNADNTAYIDNWRQSNPSIALAALATYNYNPDGQVTNESLNGGSRTWTYNSGRLTGLDETLPGLTRATTLGYDTTGRITTETTAGVTTSYAYDAASQMVSATPTTGTALTWTYDKLGRRASEKSGATTTRYVYDPASQLCWTTTKATPVTLACNSPLTGAATFAWDPNGRLVNETRTATNKVDYTYNSAGQLATLNRVNGAKTTTQGRSYQPDGMLTGVDNTIVTATTTTQKDTAIDWDPFAVGVPQPLAFTADDISTDLTIGPAGWISIGLGLNNKPLGVDIHHSAVPTTGTTAVARNATYSAYGDPAGTDTFDPRLGYRGELTLDNQLYLRARTYEPSIGRFTSRDRLHGVPGESVVADWYNYASNDPLNSSDPTGLRPIGDRDLPNFGVPVFLPLTPAEQGTAAKCTTEAGFRPDCLAPDGGSRFEPTIIATYSDSYPIFEGTDADAKAAMRRLRQSPNDYFPFRVLEESCTEPTCALSISVGRVLSLEGDSLTGSNPGHVEVIAATDSYFTFHALEDHVAKDGFITFQIAARGDGIVELRVRAFIARMSSESIFPPFTAFIGQLTWSRMAAAFRCEATYAGHEQSRRC
jgi:RHS repeat-associated protein